MQKVKCLQCKKYFNARGSHIKMGWGKFCSKECHYLSMKKGIYVKCEVCGKSIYRNPNHLKHSKSGKSFCSKSCQTIWRNHQYAGPKHKLWKGGISNDFYRDILNRSKVQKVCRLCNNNDIRILAVHHIDHNHNNNKIENLTYLCHNCHRLVHLDKKENIKLLSITMQK